MTVGWRPKFHRLYPIKVHDASGSLKEYISLADESGTIYSLEEVLSLFEEVMPFYEIENATEMIKDHNVKLDLEHRLAQFPGIGLTSTERGTFVVPEAIFKYKPFDPEKRHWSCKCGWCGVQVSSKTDKGYYSLHNSTFDIYDRACSEDCSKLIWKDCINNWIHEHGYEKYFEQ